MSRLNATIKLFFCIGELFFVIVSLGFVAASSLVALGRVDALAFDEAKQVATYVLILSAVVLLCTCFGCCGAVRQTMRRGCSGRRILSLHQLLLLVVLYFSYTNYEWLNKREFSMQLVISDDQSYAEYDAFEKRINKYFNGAYFNSLCSSDPSTKWLLNFVDKHCPARMSQDYCALTERQSTCDTSCNKDDLTKCCPSEIPCSAGNKLACPYHKCRVEILEELLFWTGPATLAAQFVCLLSSLMLVLSCLLICFNPRDDIEIELLKSGVMNEEDIDAIRRLRESKNVTTKRGSFTLEGIEAEKKQQRKFGLLSRKRLNRISPSPSPSP